MKVEQKTKPTKAQEETHPTNNQDTVDANKTKKNSDLLEPAKETASPNHKSTLKKVKPSFSEGFSPLNKPLSPQQKARVVRQSVIEHVMDKLSSAATELLADKFQNARNAVETKRDDLMIFAIRGEDPQARLASAELEALLKVLASIPYLGSPSIVGHLEVCKNHLYDAKKNYNVAEYLDFWQRQKAASQKVFSQLEREMLTLRSPEATREWAKIKSEALPELQSLTERVIEALKEAESLNSTFKAASKS